VNDYIEVGIFALDSYNSDGRSKIHPLYLKKYKLTAGQHSIAVIVKGKPAYIGIDPYATLIDINRNDNLKGIVY
jgi:ABC-2 type transport system permease protein